MIIVGHRRCKKMDKMSNKRRWRLMGRRRGKVRREEPGGEKLCKLIGIHGMKRHEYKTQTPLASVFCTFAFSYYDVLDSVK